MRRCRSAPAAHPGLDQHRPALAAGGAPPRKHVPADIPREMGGLLRQRPPITWSAPRRHSGSWPGSRRGPSGEGPDVKRVRQHSDVAALFERLSKLSQGERVKLPGVSAGRVAQLPAGAIVADAILDLMDVEAIELCPWALREGVILRRLDLLAQGLGVLPPAVRQV